MPSSPAAAVVFLATIHRPATIHRQAAIHRQAVMLIDCDTCVVRGSNCRDCVVTVILNSSGQPVELDDTEQVAVASLVAVGLVPPLRLVPHQTPRLRVIA